MKYAPYPVSLRAVAPRPRYNPRMPLCFNISIVTLTAEVLPPKTFCCLIFTSSVGDEISLNEWSVNNGIAKSEGATLTMLLCHNQHQQRLFVQGREVQPDHLTEPS